MSFASLRRHVVTVYRDVAVLDAGEPTYDSMGHPVTEEEAVGTWRCRINPLAQNREVEQQAQAGPVISDHVLFGFRDGAPRASDRVVEAATGRSFEVVADPEDGGGAGHHVEVRCRLISSSDPELPTS